MSERDQSFASEQEWILRGRSWLTRRGPNVRAICYDAKGRHCPTGFEFGRAQEEGAFPVRYIWPDQVAKLAVENNFKPLDEWDQIMPREIYFPSEDVAQAALTKANFALGNQQRDDPRGVMFDYDGVSKWRNLTGKEKEDLHGVYQRRGRGGPVQIVLSDHCPKEAAKALAALGSTSIE